MTIIGLTSIAESKSVIGADYSDFLIKKYRILKFIRIYHLLIAFALVNILSLITMSFNNVIIQSVTLVLVLFSSILAMIYFFAFILVTNHSVEKAIYIDSLSMCYEENESPIKFEPDRIAQMNTGESTDKQIPSYVFTYFNEYDSDRLFHFLNLFGPKSFLYDAKAYKKAYVPRKTKKNFKPYDYKGKYNTVLGKDVPYRHISFECMMVLRNTALPEKWSIEILKSFFPYGKDCPEFQTDCFNRVLGIINQFCPHDSIREYKFSQNLRVFINQIHLCNNAEKLAYAYKQLLILTTHMLLFSANEYAVAQSHKTIDLIFGYHTEKNHSAAYIPLVLTYDDIMDIAIEVLKNELSNECIQDLFAYIVTKYETLILPPAKYTRNDIKDKFSNTNNCNPLTALKAELFSNR